MSKVFATGRYVLLSLFVFSAVSFSQTKTLTRKYDPVVYQASSSALAGMTINELYAYRYDSQLDQWVPIPFQIDEIDDAGTFLFEGGNGIVDARDEAVFMPEEGTQDKAPTNKWLNDNGAMQNTRIELEVTDPIDGKKGWVYLYRKLSSPPGPVSYFTYTPATEKGNDRIEGKSYSEASDTSGWYTDASVLLSAGGDGLDFIDRQKLTAEGSFLGSPLKLRESEIFTFRNIKENFTTGAARVRGLRALSLRASLAGLATADASFIKQFFPYSSVYRFQGINIPDLGILGRISKARISIDMNQHASGMKFLNQANRTGVTVDGVADNIADKTLLPAPQLNWFMVTGTQGTMLVLAQVPQIGQTRSLYYVDDSTLNPEDSGDQRAYGDFLFEITQQTGSISGKFDFEIVTYYFEPLTGDPAATGDQFKAWHDPSNSLQIGATEQTRTTTAVTDRGGLPSSFTLDEAQPNPFWQQRGSVRLSFSLPQSITSPRLRIYNLIGQEVARFDFKSVQATGSKYQVQWDGRAANGQMLPAGIYFYQLQAGTQVATKKLVIIR